MAEPALVSLLLIALCAGLAMPAGALLGCYERVFPAWLDEELRHGILAMGAGALMSAVALVLVPEGIHAVSIPAASISFLAGSLAFMWADIWLAKHQFSASQLVSMLIDFIPESVALGTAAAIGSGSLLLGVLGAVQNFPEGFNAYRELKDQGHFSNRRIIGLFTLMAFSGPLMALMGFYWLADYPAVVSCIMLFAAGGILYSLLQDIAPQVKMDNHWAPPLGGVLGFMIGLLGYMLERGG